MTGFSPLVLLMLVASVAAQVLAVFLLPMTKGFTQPLPSIAAAIAVLTGFGLMARIAYSGVNLSTLMPIIAATVPLGGIAAGIIFYGEAASIAKIAALVGACILVGVATLL